MKLILVMASVHAADPQSSDTSGTETRVQVPVELEGDGYDEGYADGAAAALELSLTRPAAVGCCVGGGSLFLGWGCAGIGVVAIGGTALLAVGIAVGTNQAVPESRGGVVYRA
jgi:hypothetical protein